MCLYSLALASNLNSEYTSRLHSGASERINVDNIWIAAFYGDGNGLYSK